MARPPPLGPQAAPLSSWVESVLQERGGAEVQQDVQGALGLGAFLRVGGGADDLQGVAERPNAEALTLLGVHPGTVRLGVHRHCGGAPRRLHRPCGAYRAPVSVERRAAAFATRSWASPSCSRSSGAAGRFLASFSSARKARRASPYSSRAFAKSTASGDEGPGSPGAMPLERHGASMYPWQGRIWLPLQPPAQTTPRGALPTPNPPKSVSLRREALSSAGEAETTVLVARRVLLVAVRAGPRLRSPQHAM